MRRTLIRLVAGLVLTTAGTSCGKSSPRQPDLPRPPKAEAAESQGDFVAPLAAAPMKVVTAAPPEQPFHFNHAIHAGQYQIPCQMCHTYADHSPIAGIPTASKCMGCHKFVDKKKPGVVALEQAFHEGAQIEWNRVYRLPDHVFFNHERHVRKGVQCQTCHGEVEKMEVVHQVTPLTMGWCIQCHKANGAPADNCIVCHK